LTEQDVIKRADDMGVCNSNMAWKLLDRNGDLEATLEEVMQSVEEVRINKVATHAGLHAMKSTSKSE
jgi:hypothetical protein